jgi:hypothetical protein
MSPRKPVQSLRLLSLNKFSIFVQNVVEKKSQEIVSLDRSCFETYKTLKSGHCHFVEKLDYRSEIVDNYMELLRTHIFSQVAYSLVHDVVQKV